MKGERPKPAETNPAFIAVGSSSPDLGQQRGMSEGRGRDGFTRLKAPPGRGPAVGDTLELVLASVLQDESCRMRNQTGIAAIFCCWARWMQRSATSTTIPSNPSGPSP